MQTEENLEESTLNSWRKFYNPGREGVLKLIYILLNKKRKKKNFNQKKKQLELI